jgi:hypothetical protein
MRACERAHGRLGPFEAVTGDRLRRREARLQRCMDAARRQWQHPACGVAREAADP